METLGEDLLLLAVRPNGKLGAAPKLRFGLSGSELVRLAAARRVDIVRGRIVILDTTPTGDDLLDAALQDMAGGRRQPATKAWVARSRRGLVERYLDRLAAAGAIRGESHQVMGVFPATRWVVADTERQARLRARLDAIASGSAVLDSAQAAFAGLADAIGLSQLLYPGFSGSAARKNLKKAAKRERTESPAVGAVADAAAASDAATRAAQDATTHAAQDAATRAAVDASVRAATDAAVAASIDAATQAAIAAATDAAQHAAADHGGAAGGHHH